MSIALQRSTTHPMEAAGVVRGISCIAVYDLQGAVDGRSLPAAAAPPLPKSDSPPGVLKPSLGRGMEDEEDAASCSSSIGRNSDCSGRSPGTEVEEDSGEPEVQSKLKGPLDTTAALEEALPIRRGISKFYCGKSKSFTSLADISSSSSSSASSAKDLLAKPVNAYTRKRKNLLAFSINWDRRHSSPLRSTSGSMPKRPANSGRSAASSDSNSTEGERDTPRLRPPLHPKNGKISPPQRCHLSVRSFSLADLQGAAASASSTITPSEELHKRLQ